MVTTKKTAVESAVDEAAAGVIEARRVLDQWQARHATAQAELDQVEAAPGDALLDDPDQATAWPATVRELRDQVTAATRAASAQEQRLVVAEQAWCRARAAMLEEDEVVPARNTLRTHQERTRELLAVLEEHDGPYVPAVELARARGAGVIVVGAPSPRLPKERALQMALARAQIRRDVLEAMAQGDDPTRLVAARSFAGEVSEEDCYPDEVRAGGLVPAPAYAARVAQARALVDELEGLPGLLAAELAELPDRADRERWEPGVLESAVTRRQARLEEIPEQLVAARGQLSALTGQPVAVG